jgi:hypothetical protein
MRTIRALFLAVLVSLTLSAFSGRAEAICFADNISNGGNPYHMDWTSPDGTGHWSGTNVVYVQLHQTCGWFPSGYLTGTMRWFDSGMVYGFVGATHWNSATATWAIQDTQQGQVYRFSCNYVRPVLWHCAMDRLQSNGTYVTNGTVDLW